MKVLGRGVYTFREASSLTQLPYHRVREWFRGDAPRPVFLADYAPVDGEMAISFLDLIDVLVAGNLRKTGVSLQRIRRIYDQSSKEMGAHPFARNSQLFVDKARRRVFRLEAANKLYEIQRRQFSMAEVLIPFLDRVEYDPATKLAIRWRPAKAVLVDPAVNFGAPVVERTGVPTHVLARAYEASAHDVRRVAAWYGVEVRDVNAAVAFENDLVA